MDDITVEELYEQLEKLIDEGKGDYRVTCEGGCVGIDGIYDIDDLNKKIILD